MPICDSRRLHIFVYMQFKQEAVNHVPEATPFLVKEKYFKQLGIRMHKKVL